ncbi:Hypothetical Protein FCC1311_096552 [Hondaea fermentalgiana]|uniref:Oxidation resistance protein 1 n=1 Tax=Hondaea fermentalgiana TaxID=2315210 RepID=A0A2R5GRC4_9STRA|nr:Hypothetical Protein FCC1311_096552 [Hondaea fermentalgiana]|eukprot:GBG33432.1 Hypothetical Protein FCC1311_096552 [Hondaea fermentalgiana]
MGGVFCKCCEDEWQDTSSGWQWHTQYAQVHAQDEGEGEGDAESDGEARGGNEASRWGRDGAEPDPEAPARSESAAAMLDGPTRPTSKRRLSLQPASTRSLYEDALQRGDESPLPHTPPMIVASRHASLLQPIHLAELRRALPRHLRECAWQKSYCLSYAGSSLKKLNQRLAGSQAAVVVVRVNDGTLVGACVACPGQGWRAGPTSPGTSVSFGSSESFLFSLPATACSSLMKPKLLGHRNAARGRHHHNYATSSEPRHIIPSTQIYRPLDPNAVFVKTCAGHISFAEDGFWLDADLSQGGSSASRRFGLATSLCKDRFFDILALEAWVLLPC